MAFTGVHVATGYKGGFGFRKEPSVDGFQVVDSESTASATLSTLAAPAYSQEKGQPWLLVYAAADTWFAYGSAPDQTANPRILVKATTPTYIAVTAGDKWKWVAA
jgi:hypothetical protein